jgi:hypothetical protein
MDAEALVLTTPAIWINTLCSDNGKSAPFFVSPTTKLLGYHPHDSRVKAGGLLGGGQELAGDARLFAHYYRFLALSAISSRSHRLIPGSETFDLAPHVPPAAAQRSGLT